MKHEPVKISILAIALFAFAYIASYVGVRVVKPEFINTNDGPIAAYRKFYYPLRYIESHKPDWYWQADHNWLAVTYEEHRRGELEFIWTGVESRARAGEYF